MLCFIRPSKGLSCFLNYCHYQFYLKDNLLIPRKTARAARAKKAIASQVYLHEFAVISCYQTSQMVVEQIRHMLVVDVHGSSFTHNVAALNFVLAC